MARIRCIKPEFFTSEDIVSLTPLARLFYVSLWCESDREGRLSWKLRTLKMRYLPGDECNIQALADELLSVGLVSLYSVDGQEYAHLPGFTKHQVINNRESDSVLPAPPFICKKKEKEGNGKPFIDASLTRESGDTHAAEGKGKEGKGRERKGKEGKSYDISGMFDEFWTEFPKHANRSNKAETLAAWNVLPKSDQDDAIVGLRKHKALYMARHDFSQTGWEYFKGSQSWLRKRCWEIEDDTPLPQINIWHEPADIPEASPEHKEKVRQFHAEIAERRRRESELNHN